MFVGTTSFYMVGIREDQRPLDSSNTANDIEEDDNDDDSGAVSGNPTSSLLVVTLAAQSCMPLKHDKCLILILIFIKIESGYPQDLKKLTAHIWQLKLPLAFHQSLFCKEAPPGPPSLYVSTLGVARYIASQLYLETPSLICNCKSNIMIKHNTQILARG